MKIYFHIEYVQGNTLRVAQSAVEEVTVHEYNDTVDNLCKLVSGAASYLKFTDHAGETVIIGEALLPHITIRVVTVKDE